VKSVNIYSCEVYSKHAIFYEIWGSHGVKDIHVAEVRPEDEGNMFLRNVSIYLQVHMTLLPRRPIPALFVISNIKMTQCLFIKDKMHYYNHIISHKLSSIAFR
jgi:hypothetical protein